MTLPLTAGGTLSEATQSPAQSQRLKGRARTIQRRQQAEEREREARLSGKRGPIQVTVLWAGGWDDLKVDMTTARPLNDEEREQIDSNTYSPFVGKGGGWLRCSFVRDLDGRELDDSVVHITEKIGSGD